MSYYRPRIECLEEREVLSGYTPDQLLFLYGLSRPVAAGTGQAVAIVVAGNDPTICQDLHAFDQANGIPDPLFSIVNQLGGETLPNAVYPGWPTETALDVEWAHALAPGAAILLVEAGTPGLDLVQAAYTAGRWAGVSVVSCSWGSPSVAPGSYLDAAFTFPGVTYVAAAGDTAQAIWPAVVPGVLPVAGTTLPATGAETPWPGSGPGVVSWDADPATGVGIVSAGQSLTVGGTSAGAPAWAGIVAWADQQRAAQGLAPLSGADSVLSRLGPGDVTDLASPNTRTVPALGQP